MNHRTNKLMKYKILRPMNVVDGLYMSGRKGRGGLVNIQESVDESILRPEDYTKIIHGV